MTRLAGRTWGAGQRTAILLHGSTSSSRTWWRVAPQLADADWTVTAFDLPSHGNSPAAERPLTPDLAADTVASQLTDSPVDLLIGHSFGAAVATALAARQLTRVRKLVLEELPGARSVDWQAEADACRAGHNDARQHRTRVLQHTRSTQPRWTYRDCRYAVDDLAACHAADVAAGLTLGPTWTPAATLEAVTADVVLLLAPDAPGVNHLDDATALRGHERTAAQSALKATVAIAITGHCIHRDDPNWWLRAVTR